MTREEAEKYADNMTYRDAINNLIKARSIPYRKATFIKVNELLKALEQEPKTGHWSHDGSHWKNRFICSECGYKLFEEQTNYCPNCGCRMVAPQESDNCNQFSQG